MGARLSIEVVVLTRFGEKDAWDALAWSSGSRTAEAGFDTDEEELPFAPGRGSADEYSGKGIAGDLKSPGETSADMLAGLQGVLSHPLLGAVEERELAVRIREGDEKAFRRLVECNFRLVWQCANWQFRTRPASLTLPDLFQEGCCGLILSARKFDPARGTRFSTYAVPWIRQSISRALSRQDRVVRLPEHVLDKRRTSDNVAQALTQEFGRSVAPYEVASRVPGDYRSYVLQSMVMDVLSLDQPAYGNEGETYLDALADSGTCTEGEVLQAALRREVEHALGALNERESFVVRHRFGLQGERSHTLAEIGTLLDIHPETVRQIEKTALGRLRRSPALGAISGLEKPLGPECRAVRRPVRSAATPGPARPALALTGPVAATSCM